MYVMWSPVRVTVDLMYQTSGPMGRDKGQAPGFPGENKSLKMAAASGGIDFMIVAPPPLQNFWIRNC